MGGETSPNSLLELHHIQTHIYCISGELCENIHCCQGVKNYAPNYALYTMHLYYALYGLLYHLVYELYKFCHHALESKNLRAEIPNETKLSIHLQTTT